MSAVSLRGFMVLACLMMAPGRGNGKPGSDSTGFPRTNLEVMQSVLGRIAREIIGSSHIKTGDTIELRVTPADDAWIAQNAVASECRATGCTVFIRSDTARHSGYELHIFSSELHVHYDDMFHDGFLGTRRVRRTISATLTCDVTGAGSHELVYSGSPSLASADTVAAGDVANLELPSAKATRADLPSESFLDRVLEPVVIIGATGVSIYLLFHVRS